MESTVFKAQTLGTEINRTKSLAFLVNLDLLLAYMVLSHEQNKQRSAKMKRLFKELNPNGFKFQSERKRYFRTLKQEGSCITSPVGLTNIYT